MIDRAREAGFRRLLGAGKSIHVEDSRYILARLDDCRSALPALAERVLALEALARENIGDAYNLLTQGESPLARRQPSAQRIYDRSKAALAAEEHA